MRNKVLAFGFAFFFGFAALAALGQSGLSEDNNFYHSESVSVTAASQYVSTTKMRQSVCDAWLFRNRSATETVYINANSAVGFAGPAFVDDTNMIVVPPAESIELEDAVIKRFSVIGSGTAELYWLCACK